LIPIHPLQAQWLLHQEYVLELVARERLIDVGRLGPSFTPTSSVRTLYCETLDFMVKVSLPVKITNSLRINLKSELGDSVWISQLLRRCDVSGRYPGLCPIEDPAYITVALPDREETGFEVIYRSNPFRRTEGKTTGRVQSVAALVQDALPGQTSSQLAEIVGTLAQREGVTVSQAGRLWFEAYLRCSIEPTLALYDELGVSLEAHQQNVLLEFNEAGYPSRCYYRDIQGLALAEGAREQLLAIVPELEQQAKVFEANEIVRNGFGYYVFFNQLYSVINRLAIDGFATELELLELVRSRLIELRRTMDRFGAAFIDTMLSQRQVPCKANLLTRVVDMDELRSENELAVYSLLDNPLCRESVGAR
jgi:siderophore synthetase component